MKKLSRFLMVIAIAMFLAVPSFGQSSVKDSIKAAIKTMVTNADSGKASNMQDYQLSDELVKKLSNKELMELIELKETLRNKRQDDDPMVIFIVFGSFILMMLIPFYFGMKKTRSQNQLISSMIEKGQEIPKELLSPAKKARTVRSDMHKGIILFTFGLSLCLVLFLTKVEDNFWTIGLIPAIVGIGYLISYRFTNGNNNKTEIK